MRSILVSAQLAILFSLSILLLFLCHLVHKRPKTLYFSPPPWIFRRWKCFRSKVKQFIQTPLWKQMRTIWSPHHFLQDVPVVSDVRNSAFQGAKALSFPTRTTLSSKPGWHLFFISQVFQYSLVTNPFKRSSQMPNQFKHSFKMLLKYKEPRLHCSMTQESSSISTCHLQKAVWAHRGTWSPQWINLLDFCVSRNKITLEYQQFSSFSITA